MGGAAAPGSPDGAGRPCPQRLRAQAAPQVPEHTQRRAGLVLGRLTERSLAQAGHRQPFCPQKDKPGYTVGLLGQFCPSPHPQHCCPSVWRVSCAALCRPVPRCCSWGGTLKPASVAGGGTEASLVKCQGSRGHLWQMRGGFGSLGLRVLACPGQRDCSRGCLEMLPCVSGKEDGLGGGGSDRPPSPPGSPGGHEVGRERKPRGTVRGHSWRAHLPGADRPRKGRCLRSRAPWVGLPCTMVFACDSGTWDTATPP